MPGDTHLFEHAEKCPAIEAFLEGRVIVVASGLRFRWTSLFVIVQTACRPDERPASEREFDAQVVTPARVTIPTNLTRETHATWPDVNGIKPVRDRAGALVAVDVLDSGVFPINFGSGGAQWTFTVHASSVREISLSDPRDPLELGPGDALGLVLAVKTDVDVGAVPDCGWYSSAPDIMRVRGDAFVGTVTAEGPGTATLTIGCGYLAVQRDVRVGE